MNILYITHYTELYGANRSLLDMVKELSKENHVYVVVPRSGAICRKLREMNIPYRILPVIEGTHAERLSLTEKCIRIWDILDSVKSIAQCMKEWDIDVVHSNSSVIDVGALVAFLMHRRHVWHIRELPIQYHYLFDFPAVHRMLMMRSAKIICISQYVKDKLRLNGKNIEVIYNPMDITGYMINRKDYFQGAEIHILVCGVIYVNKRQLDVVEAVNQLVQRGINNIKLRIVGNGDKKYKAKIVTYIKQHNLEQYVELHDFCEDLFEYRKWADIAVMSSVYEALGRVTIESMLSELLVIGTDCGGTAELIRDGVNGFKYNPDAIDELTDKIEYAVKHREECIKIIKNAKVYAMKNFDSEKQVKKVQKVYDEIIQK